MKKINYSEHFPLSHKGIIQQLKEKIRHLTPPKITKGFLSPNSPKKTTPRFTPEKSIDNYEQNKKITRMYNRNKRATSAYPSVNLIDSQNSSQLKSASICSKIKEWFFIFINVF